MPRVFALQHDPNAPGLKVSEENLDIQLQHFLVVKILITTINCNRLSWFYSSTRPSHYHQGVEMSEVV